MEDPGGEGSVATLFATSRDNHQLLQADIGTKRLAVLRMTADTPDSVVVTAQGRLIYDEPVVNELRCLDPTANTDTLLAGFDNGINSPQDLLLEPGGTSVLVSNFTGAALTRTNLTTGATSVLAKIASPEVWLMVRPQTSLSMPAGVDRIAPVSN